MRRVLLHAVSALVVMAATLWFLALPSWNVLQLVALAAVGASMYALLGEFAAGFVVVGLLAAQGSDTGSDNGFFVVVLPVLAVLSFGGLLACLVARLPSLGREIPHGPFGPGGI